MTVGETLTEARCQAGLSVDEVSERTRIRPTVIRSIEQDDYAACGGELYVRGYVRAIAGAVGIDALPLISQFDQAQPGGAEGDAPEPPGSPGVPDSDATRFDLPAQLALPGVPDSDATRFDLHAVADAGLAADPDATRFDLAALAGAGPPADPDATRFDLPAVPAFDPPADPDATRFDLPLIPGPPFGAGVDATAPFGEVPPGEAPPAAFPPAAFPHGGPPRDSEDTRFDLGPVTDDDLMAAGYQLPGSPAQAWQGPPWQSAPPPPVPPAPVRPGQAAGGGAGRRAIGYTAIAAVAVAALVVLAVHLAGGGSTAHGAAGASPSRQAAAPGGSGSASASAGAKASATARASAAATATKPAAAARVTHLPIAAARAFGPDGFADGDNAGLAGYTIAANPAEIWSTQWYATPDFGLLKHGTGLLLDLGSQVTITGVRFDLTQYRGASLQIKVGNGTAQQSLRVAASAKDAGGVVRIALPHPQLARYLVIWFTLLAPDGAGHFQESVSHVAIAGNR